MSWEWGFEKEEEPKPEPKEVEIKKVEDRYVALVGLSFDKLGIRVEAGQELTPEMLEDDFIFDWLLNKRKAIEKIEVTLDGF